MSMNNYGFEKIRVKYISEQKSIFFKKGEMYDAYIPNCNGGKGVYAFYMSENDMDEEGMYVLPADRFEVVEDGR